MDRLQQIFDCQKKLQYKIANVELPQEIPELITTHVTGLVAELGEVLQADKRWKPWCKNPPEPESRERRLDEAADMLTFLVNIILMSGFDADEIYNAFVDKNKVNNKN